MSYQKKFQVYAHGSVPWQQEIIADFLAKVSLDPEPKILDAGSGIGNNLITLKNFSQDITACDQSIQALNYSKERHDEPYIRFQEENIEDLPYPDSHFDLVVCTEVLEHVENMNQAVEELARVTKKEGHLIISTPNYCNPAGVIKKIMDHYRFNEQRWDVWGTHGDYDKERFITSFKLKKILTKNKITPIKERGGDLLNSWFLFCLFESYKFTDRHPFLKLGKIPFLKKLLMNYFVLGEINSHR